MKKYQKLEIDLLDKKFADFKEIGRPKKGWINKIRKSLSMTLVQLAKRLGVSAEAVLGYERSELGDNISLKTLRKTSQAMNCRLYYCIIPDDQSIAKVIENRVRKKAQNIIDRVDSSMSLEGQNVNDPNKSFEILVDELIRDLNSKIWQDD